MHVSACANHFLTKHQQNQGVNCHYIFDPTSVSKSYRGASVTLSRKPGRSSPCRWTIRAASLRTSRNPRSKTRPASSTPCAGNRYRRHPPIKISNILTDNGSQFTDRFSTKDKKPSGDHAFDQACRSMAIEHRLAPSRHPQTNGMVERFNGRINELLQQTRFDSRAHL
jgi:hypothetical protein